MRATGSRFSRRAASAASVRAASSPRFRPPSTVRPVVEAKRMAGEQARVELGRIQMRLAEGVGEGAARLGDGHVRQQQQQHQVLSAASSSA